MDTVAYGDHPEQVAGVWDAPPGTPLVVLLHGGFFYRRYTRSLMDPLATDLATRGFGVVNLEYRRLGCDGGWPTTFEDVATGIDTLAAGSGPVVTVGHSAGGLLALWAAARARLPAGRVGAEPTVSPAAAVSLAGLNDLRAAAREEFGRDAIPRLLGGPLHEVAARIRVAAPIASLPLGVPQLLVHGVDDDLVGLHQSEDYARLAAAAGDAVDLVRVDGDHFAVIDPSRPAWRTVVGWIERTVGA